MSEQQRAKFADWGIAKYGDSLPKDINGKSLIEDFWECWQTAIASVGVPFGEVGSDYDAPVEPPALSIGHEYALKLTLAKANPSKVEVVSLLLGGSVVVRYKGSDDMFLVAREELTAL